MKFLPAFLFCAGTALAVGCTKNEDAAPVATVASVTAQSNVAPTADEAERPTLNQDLSSVHRFTVTDINGQRVSLSRYRGRKILIVNTASQCGYTPQYTDLQTLSVRYADRVVVLGFPSNDFGGQEPGTDGQIAGFCSGVYNVTFPMFHRVSVAWATAIPLYRFLGDQNHNGVLSDRPTWNFCKYLIDESGHVVRFYPSAVTPLSANLLADILAPSTQVAAAQVRQ